MVSRTVADGRVRATEPVPSGSPQEQSGTRSGKAAKVRPPGSFRPLSALGSARNLGSLPEIGRAYAQYGKPRETKARTSNRTSKSYFLKGTVWQKYQFSTCHRNT